MPQSRRDFLATAALGALACSLRARAASEPPALPTIALGATGRMLPRLGIGCYPLGNLPKEDDGIAILLRAFDLGVRYIDTAPSYGDGRSETRVGIALKQWLAANKTASRADFFIATKTLRRDATGAREELDASLKRLQLDHVDSVQLHEVHDDAPRLFTTTPDHTDEPALARPLPAGVINGLEGARTDKLLTHISITGHRNPKWLTYCIQRYPFATALVPVNPIDTQHRSFVRDFLPLAAERKVPVVAMKVFGGGFLLNTKTADGRAAFTPAELLTYALAQPAVAIAIPGCERIEHVETDQAAIAAFKQPTPDWLTACESRAGKHEGKPTEWYKDP